MEPYMALRRLLPGASYFTRYYWYIIVYYGRLQLLFVKSSVVRVINDPRMRNGTKRIT